MLFKLFNRFIYCLTCFVLFYNPLAYGSPSPSFDPLLNNEPSFTVHNAYLSVFVLSALLSFLVLPFRYRRVPVNWAKRAIMLVKLHQNKYSEFQQCKEIQGLQKALYQFGIHDQTLFLRLAEDPRLNCLDTSQIQWLACALSHGHSIDDAFNVVNHKDLLVFNPNAQTITIHGLSIHMPKTVLTFYTWFALRQMDGVPAYTPFASELSDKVNGAVLSELMIGYGIQDPLVRKLQHQGLKPKMLDRHINQIEKILYQSLGELAPAYFISKQHHSPSARFQYLLAIPKRLIRIVI